MDPVISIRPLLAVAVAGLAALAVLLLNNREKLRDVVSPLAALAMFAIVASMAPTVLAGGTVDLRLFEILPGIDFAFRVDALGMVFATVSSLLWIVAAIYSIGYMRHERARRPVLRLLRRQPRGGRRGRLRRQSVHAGDLLRGAQPRHLSARLPPRGRRGMDGQPQVPRLFDGRVEERASRRAGADLPLAGSLDFVAGGCWRGSMPRRRC